MDLAILAHLIIYDADYGETHYGHIEWWIVELEKPVSKPQRVWYDF
jgi:hypothetical protein